MATLISGVNIYAPVFKVELVKNKKILPIDSFTSVDIDENLESPAMFTLSLNETIDINKQTFRWLDDPSITLGTEIVIYFGYAKSLGKQSLIRSRIKALSPGFLSTGVPTLSIEGYDLSHDFHKTEAKFNGKDVTYSKVVEDIAKANGLDPGGIESTRIVHKKVERRKNEKDYVFIKRLADEIGFEFFVRDRTLYFRVPKDNESAKVTLEFRQTFINFTPRMTTATLVNEVRVTAWNEKDKEPISETASIRDIKSKVGIPDFDRIIEQSQGQKIKVKIEGLVVRSKEEAKNLAIAELKRRNKGFIEGSVECVGDPQLRPGMTVNIEKIGARFSGVYYVTKTRHSIGEGGYKTTLDVRRSM
jgi:phage protein D